MLEAKVFGYEYQLKIHSSKILGFWSTNVPVSHTYFVNFTFCLKIYKMKIKKLFGFSYKIQLLKHFTGTYNLCANLLFLKS